MSDIVSFSPVRAFDRNGDPVAGALALFFTSGTTEPITVYADADETIPHAVPLEADSRGIFPPVYLSGIALRVVVTDPDGVTLPGFPIDPAITISALGSAAAEIGFAPTGDIPVTNVQAAIERVQANAVAPLLAGGIGVTGSNTLLTNFNAQDTPSGFYRFDATTTGDRPTGWAGADTGVVSFLRENAGAAIMEAVRPGAVGKYYRRLNSGAWSNWVRVIDSSEVSAASDFTVAPTSFADRGTIRNLVVADRQFRTAVNIQVVAQGTAVQNTRGKAVFFSIALEGNNSDTNSTFQLQVSFNGSDWNVSQQANTSQGLDNCTFTAMLPPAWFFRVLRASGGNTAGVVRYTEVY